MIPPLGVVARESTETVAFKDPRLCEAIEYLNAAHRGSDRRAGVGVARGRFAALDGIRVPRRLKESPYQYIRNRRLKLAQHLLEKDTRLKIRHCTA